MNCPSRTDEPEDAMKGMNQSPNALSADLTTREDLNGKVNRPRGSGLVDGERIPDTELEDEDGGKKVHRVRVEGGEGEQVQMGGGPSVDAVRGGNSGRGLNGRISECVQVLKKFGKFCGPGMMISVAYIDPGNYSTDVAAGASYRFRLLFIVLMSNVFAIFLQNMCIKLGTVSGLNLAQACKKFLPVWLNIVLYIMAEAAIIATDIAEVIGTAIAINLLIPKIPLVAGCALSICDVLLILLFYNPSGGMKGLRFFELFVAALVLGVVVCFCIQLSLIKDTPVGEVFRGFLPSSAIIQRDGLYQACGILGATVMPHSLYLGSGIVQPRLQEYDLANGISTPSTAQDNATEELDDKEPYYPSLPAIKHCLNYSMAELTLCLGTFALFVNSAILITAGASLSGTDAEDADLFGIYDLLSSSISRAAGTIFALALLLSGISAGIVCTIAGQMVSEGALNWKCRPWMRRAITRSISITPSIIIAGAVGRPGLSAALNGSQVALSIVLPFVTAPLIYFTCRDKFMTVRPHENGSEHRDDEEFNIASEAEGVKMGNHWITATFGVAIWITMACMNVANLVLVGKGQA